MFVKRSVELRVQQQHALLAKKRRGMPAPDIFCLGRSVSNTQS